ncbi:MAG: cytochrome c maturation protein CcmE [Pseudomonadota bacterium]|nr:cytochrome c maturation protein CcmE [Pseudomonadota bacterium]
MTGKPRTPVTMRKRRRLYIVLAGLTMLGVAAALVLTALEDNIVFFHSPSNVKAKAIGPGQHFRMGGLVKKGSVDKVEDGLVTNFEVTDLDHSVKVSYRGILPDLFREGQGVVTEGALRSDGVFIAREVLAKHDENYMPPEVAAALKKSGKWKHLNGEGEKK